MSLIKEDSYQFVFLIDHKETDEDYVIKNKTYFFMSKKINEIKENAVLLKPETKIRVLKGIE